MSSPALALGTGFHFLSIKFPSSLPILMVPLLALFAIYTLFKQIALGRGAVYSLFAEIISLSQNVLSKERLSICSCSAFSGYWAVANGGYLQGFFNSATFGQVVTQVEKKHADVSKLSSKRTPFSGTLEVPLPELKKPGRVR